MGKSKRGRTLAISNASSAVGSGRRVADGIGGERCPRSVHDGLREGGVEVLTEPGTAY